MANRTCYFIPLSCVLLSFLTSAVAQKPNGPPDIVIILADDMGFSDIGCYGGEIQTPHLDRMAAGGLRFTQFYNTARCCPTRASLLTGLYPHQAGIGHMMEDRGTDGYRGDLNQRCVTIAEVLKPAGYATFALGKWHVTRFVKAEGPKHNWPLQRGFDRFYGTIVGAGSFYDPGTLVRDNTMISAYADQEYKPSQYYYTDAISDQATRFIADHHRAHTEQPLFMYVAFTAAHWPMHALEEDIAKYRGKYDAGYAAIRQARWERMVKLGLIDAGMPLAPPAVDFQALEDKAWEARCMEVYAAMIDRMDRGIGRIMAQLKQTGRLENTLLLFLQDNGGCAETVGREAAPGEATERLQNPTLEPLPADWLETAIRPTRTRDGFPVLRGRHVMPGPRDTFIAYGPGWAHVSNTPFREYKHWVHEGGISTPLVAHWPAGIKRGGELERQPGHLIDLMATCIDLSQAKYPQQMGEHAIQPPEGRSLRGAFAGQPLQREAIYWEHEGNRAIRVGAWKLVAKEPEGAWELYDIANDRMELRNLVHEKPELAGKLRAQWESWANRTAVLPWIWKPAYGAK